MDSIDSRLRELYEEKKGCPDCGWPEFLDGPGAGAMKNKMCARCGAEFGFIDADGEKFPVFRVTRTADERAQIYSDASALAREAFEREMIGGRHCVHCSEPILTSDSDQYQSLNGNQLVHKDCLMRMIIGSVGHQLHKCSCYGGDEDDPPGMTVRQAARAAAEEFRKNRRG